MKKKSNFNIFLSGFFSGSTKVLIGYPFETIKSKKQLNIKYDIFSPKSLYKGFSIPLILNSTKRGLQMSIYEKNSNSNKYLAGFYSGIISSLIMNPINIIKTNIQTNKYPNIRSQLNINVLYRGNFINIIRETLFTSYYLGTYNNIKQRLPNESKYYALSGIISGSTLWLFFTPFDTIRTMIYTGMSYKDIFNIINKKPFSLWNGCKPMIIKSIPVNMFNMTLYEYLKKY